jgi:hypothetical protein
MEQHFRLYTWQLPDWDITKEKRDLSKGPLRWGEDVWNRLQPLYKKLEENVGTLDFVWCYPAYKHWTMTEKSRLWKLDVPSSKIFHVLDSKIWDTMVQAALNNKQPEDASWDKLIVERSEGVKKLSAGNNDDIAPLVLVPLCTSIQVICKDKFNKGTRYTDAKYKDLPTSECEAKRCRDEGPKRGAWRQQR